MVQKRQATTLKWTIPLALVLLSACGGGGLGESDLTVTAFSYDAASNLYTPIVARPTLVGIEGHSPHCSISAGSLPPGETMGSDCILVGTPTAAGSYTATVTLTVDGYKGSVSTTIYPSVYVPQLVVVSDGRSASPNQTVTAGAQLSSFPVVSVRGYVPAPGNTLAYSVIAGALPPGVTLNAADGTLSGVVGGNGTFSFSIGLAISYAGNTFRTDPQPVVLAATVPQLLLGYPNCCSAELGDSVSSAPVSAFPVFAGVVSSYTAVSGVPPGISLDPQTGVLSGVPMTPGMYVAVIERDVTLPSGASQSIRTGVGFNIIGPDPQYPANSVFPQPGQPFEMVLTSMRNGRPGDVYSFALAPYPGSSFTGNASGMPVPPPFIQIDPITGRIYGVGTGGTTRYQYELLVVVTTTRAGRTYTTNKYFEIF